MKDYKLDDYKLEIMLLQQKDYNNAQKLGFNNKKDWYDYIINQDNDEIADAIIKLAERYDILIENAANSFDHTMLMRVGKILKNQNKVSFKK